MIIIRRFWQGGKIGDFRQFQLPKRFIKIIQRRRRNAVTAPSKINFVQIERQNLIFAKSAFHPKRQDRLFDFAVNRDFIGQQKIFCNLLGDRRSTDRPPPFAIIDDIGHNGPRQGAKINAKMIIKRFIFSRNKSVDQSWWDCLNRHEKPLFTRIFSQQRAVASMNAGHNRWFIIGELLIVRKAFSISPENPKDASTSKHAHQENKGQYNRNKSYHGVDNIAEIGRRCGNLDLFFILTFAF